MLCDAMPHNANGLPQYGPTLNWAAGNWRTFYFTTIYGSPGS
jgi:hypothetical protein